MSKIYEKWKITMETPQNNKIKKRNKKALWFLLSIQERSWWDARQTERDSWASRHCRRLRAVPPLEQRLRTASDSVGHMTATIHSANDRFMWRHAISLSLPAANRRWQPVKAVYSRSQLPAVEVSLLDIWIGVIENFNCYQLQS